MPLLARSPKEKTWKRAQERRSENGKGALCWRPVSLLRSIASLSETADHSLAPCSEFLRSSSPFSPLHVSEQEMSGTHVGAVAEARGAAERSAGGETSRSAAAVAIGSAAATASAGPAGALLVPSSCSAGGSGWAFNHGRERDCSREENGASSREENRGRVARRGEQRLHQICEYMLFSLSLSSLLKLFLCSSLLSSFYSLQSLLHHRSMTSLPRLLAEAARPVLSEAGIWKKPALSARGAAAWRKRLG